MYKKLFVMVIATLALTGKLYSLTEEQKKQLANYRAEQSNLDRREHEAIQAVKKGFSEDWQRLESNPEYNAVLTALAAEHRVAKKAMEWQSTKDALKGAGVCLVGGAVLGAVLMGKGERLTGAKIGAVLSILPALVTATVIDAIGCKDL